MAKLYSILIGLLCGGITINTAFAQLTLDGRDNYNLNGYVYVLIEKQDVLNSNNAFLAFKRHQFTKVATPDNEFYRPLVKKVYWLAIPVIASTKSSSDVEAGIANSGIYEVEYYLVDNMNGKIIRQHFTGKRYSFFSRSVRSRHYYFPVSLHTNQQAIVFFRLDKRGDGLNAPIRLLKKSYRQETEFNIYFQYAFFFGLMMFVSFFSIVSFLWTRDLVYFYHSLYVLCCCLFFLADGDLDYQWLYPDWPAWASVASSLYAIAIVFFMLLFMAEFLQLKASRPYLFKISRICTFAIAVLFILVPLGYVSGKIVNLRVIIYYYGSFCVIWGWVLSIYCIVRRVMDGHKPAYLYGIAILSVVLASIFYILQSLAITIHNFIPFNYLLFSFCLEILILSFALIYSFNYYKKQHYELSISLANEQLNFGKQLLLSQQAEQQRIARDLHDELGGNLAAMKMTIQRFDLVDPKVVLLDYLIDSASNSARNIAHDLMPPGFDDNTLEESLDRYFQQLNSNGQVRFRFLCFGVYIYFTKQQELMIYRIILELTNNITKHAQATEATIQLIYSNGYIEIIVEDNGVGFDKDKNKKGMGLSNIAIRSGYLNGTVNLDTGPKGTTVIIQIPHTEKNGAD